MRGFVADPGALCSPCWSRLAFLQPPACSCCGLPFEQLLAALRDCAGSAPRPARPLRAPVRRCATTRAAER
ncbi:MAG TPA: double zinc ribbon domain-containing protein [Alphaproteobacteria bacterium]|nr:double zinc ribbon domain-containing protein [Alphaproteobacteria bacterium]